MSKQKDFDCVQMKTDIQKQLQLEITQFGEKEAEKLRQQRLFNDPIFHRFLQAKTTNNEVETIEYTPAN